MCTPPPLQTKCVQCSQSWATQVPSSQSTAHQRSDTSALLTDLPFSTAMHALTAWAMQWVSRTRFLLHTQTLCYTTPAPSNWHCPSDLSPRMQQEQFVKLKRYSTWMRCSCAAVYECVGMLLGPAGATFMDERGQKQSQGFLHVILRDKASCKHTHAHIQPCTDAAAYARTATHAHGYAAMLQHFNLKFKCLSMRTGTCAC